MTDDKVFWLDSISAALRRWPLWLSTGIIALFLFLPFGIAWLQGTFSTLMEAGAWRVTLLAPINIVYNLLVAPIFTMSHDQIASSIRPLSQLDDEEYAALVTAASARQPRAEWIAFGVGVLAQLALFGLPQSNQPLDIFLFVVFTFMYGTMGWIIYKAIASTRVSRSLSRQPLDINIFDITPFQPIGRQSLHLAMVFIGGIVLSIIFVFSWESFLKWEDIVIYVFVGLIAVLVFFLSMWPTHGLLSRTKKHDTQNATETISTTYEELITLQEQNRSTAQIESKIDTWIGLERRLKFTRSWPYDTEMLRTLVITVLTPIVVGLSKIVGVLLASPRP